MNSSGLLSSKPHCGYNSSWAVQWFGDRCPENLLQKFGLVFMHESLTCGC